MYTPARLSVFACPRLEVELAANLSRPDQISFIRKAARPHATSATKRAFVAPASMRRRVSRRGERTVGGGRRWTAAPLPSEAWRPRCHHAQRQKDRTPRRVWATWGRRPGPDLTTWTPPWPYCTRRAARGGGSGAGWRKGIPRCWRNLGHTMGNGRHEGLARETDDMRGKVMFRGSMHVAAWRGGQREGMTLTLLEKRDTMFRHFAKH